MRAARATANRAYPNQHEGKTISMENSFLGQTHFLCHLAAGGVWAWFGPACWLPVAAISNNIQSINYCFTLLSILQMLSLSLSLPPRSEGSAQSKKAAHTLQLICHYVRAAFRQSDAIFNRFSLLTRCGSFPGSSLTWRFNWPRPNWQTERAQLVATQPDLANKLAIATAVELPVCPLSIRARPRATWVIICHNSPGRDWSPKYLQQCGGRPCLSAFISILCFFLRLSLLLASVCVLFVLLVNH